jgi:hypothetical protein
MNLFWEIYGINTKKQEDQIPFSLHRGTIKAKIWRKVTSFKSSNSQYFTLAYQNDFSTHPLSLYITPINNLPNLPRPLCPSATWQGAKQSTHASFPLLSKCVRNFLPWTTKIYSIFELSTSFRFLLGLVVNFRFQKKSLGSNSVKNPL